MAKNKKQLGKNLEDIADVSRARGDAMASTRRQIRTVAKVAGIVLVVVWLIAASMASGLKSSIPIVVASILTVAAFVGAFLIRRNLAKSEELTSLLGSEDEMNPAERAEKIAKLEERVAKGEAAAIIAKAQLQMQEAPKNALSTLEKVDLAKAQKLIADQVRAMRAMIHLSLSEVRPARELADAIDLAKVPDLKVRANFAGVVAEAWARSGNPIEASELLDKYNVDEKDFQDVRIQLLKARVFAAAHRNDLNAMKRALKQLEEISPQLLAVFASQKRVHPLLLQEVRRRLEKTGLIPKQKIQFERR